MTVEEATARGDFFKMLAVGCGSAFVSALGVGLTFIILFSKQQAVIEARQETNIESIKSLSGSVAKLEDMFRGQLVASAQLAARLDSYIEAIRDHEGREGK